MNKTEVEYEDAPSGYVTFYNYKEPLMPFTKGFGYIGALIFDGASDKIQCHFCGEWFNHLVPHIASEHGLKAYEYKEAVGLLNNTALISETARAKLIASGLDKRLQNLRSRKGTTVSKEVRKKISEGLKANKYKDEHKNLKSNCPAQLLDRIQKKYEENPKQWRIRLLKGMAPSIIRTFGSVKEACILAGVPYAEPGQNWSKTRHPMVHIKFTDKQLLAMLKKFEKINNRKPSYSDCKRGLLPPLRLYYKHFGGFRNAMKLI